MGMLVLGLRTTHLIPLQVWPSALPAATLRQERDGRAGEGDEIGSARGMGERTGKGKCWGRGNLRARNQLRAMEESASRCGRNFFFCSSDLYLPQKKVRIGTTCSNSKLHLRYGIVSRARSARLEQTTSLSLFFLSFPRQQKFNITSLRDS